jgi:TPR repeat protein
MKFSITFLICVLLSFTLLANAIDDEYNFAVQLVQERKFEQAHSLFKKLSSEGDRDAQNNLGAMFQHGHGVSVDLRKASYWYLKSAQKGNSVAEHNIGIAYFYGQGVTRNKEEGLAWIFMSILSGLAQSEPFAKRMKEQMSQQQITKAFERLMALNKKYGIFSDTSEAFELK